VLAVKFSLFYFLELLIHVLLQLIPLSDEALHVASDGLDLLQNQWLVPRHAAQLLFEHLDPLHTFLMQCCMLILLHEDVYLEPLLEEQQVLVLDVVVLQLSLLVVLIVELLVDLLL
jgi:hypothetical protein